MTGRYHSYTEYKETHTQWLGKVPIHWNVLPNKYLSEMCKGKNPSTFESDLSEQGTPYLSMGYLRGQEAPKYAKAESTAVKAKEGDILLLWDGSNAGEYIHAKSGLVSSTMARVLVNLDCVHKYYFYSCKAFEPELKQHTVGMGIPHVNGEEVRTQSFPQPPQEEQEVIANFLDHETSKIDTLIDKQQQLIKLLKEKRQAAISHAVTKGLNPAAPMKDSGVEWLGEVPEHWVVKRLGMLFSESCARANSEAELQYPFLTVSIHHGISDKELDESELDRKVSRSEDRSLYKIVSDNDLAYNMMRAWQGGFGASKLNGLISPAYVVCKPKTKINSSYYELVLRSPNAVTELKRFSRGITDFRLRLYWDEFKIISVPVPPVEEIDQILEHVNRVDSKYDQIADVAQRQIDLLQERRNALISAAVTGKIDVRNWQPAQPKIPMEAGA